MKINFTLLIQLCNFGITYYFLRLFLFKPIVDLKQHRVAQQAGIQNTLDQQKLAIDALIAQKNNALLSFRQHLQHDYALPEPTLDDASCTLEYPESPTQKKFSQDDIKRASSYLIQRIQESW